MPKSFDFTRFYSEHREVQSRTIPDNNIHRGVVSFGPRISVSNSRKSTEITVSSRQFEQKEQSNCQRFSTSVGVNSFMSRTDPKCTPIHETSSTTSSQFLETQFNEIRNRNTSYTTSKIPSEMVVRYSKHYQGQIIATTTNSCNHNNRCFQNGLWGLHRQSVCSGNLVSCSEKTAHQCSGVGGSISYTKTFSINSERPECASSVRLDNRCPIFEQTRWDSVSSDVLPDMGPLELGNRESNAHQSSSHFGAKESIGRSVEQEQGITHRMDTEQDDCFEAVPFVGSANDRSFCISGKSTSSNILFLVSSSSSTSSGCTDNFVGQDVCIRIPSTLPNSKSSATHETLQVSDNTDSTSVAQEALVHRTSPISSGLSTKTASAEKSVTSAKKQNKPSKSRSIQLDCLASLNRNFKEKGFSKKARELLTASWRNGTQKDYTSKFKKFCSWCRTRKIDSYSASLTEVADFLSDLFAEGLQYRTIAGYRSMLSSVLSPINNIPVGQHPYIIRLLKGVFNSRPPKSKLLPEWDLQKVLNMLQKEPFEPISAASLKLITYKVVFLTAISTFRRCSDLQSLKIGEKNVSVQKKGLTFIRHGLSKQDRQTHYGTKVFVPAFPENKKLDPKRAFYFYLKKTESLRTKTDGSSEDRVFLAINEPHQAVTSQTISKWIVKTIRMAYNDS